MEVLCKFPLPLTSKEEPVIVPVTVRFVEVTSVLLNVVVLNVSDSTLPNEPVEVAEPLIPVAVCNTILPAPFTENIFPNVENTYVCEKCNNEFKLDVTVTPTLLTQPVNVDQPITALKDDVEITSEYKQGTEL